MAMVMISDGGRVAGAVGRSEWKSPAMGPSPSKSDARYAYANRKKAECSCVEQEF